MDHNDNPEFESIGKVVQIIDHHKRIPRHSSSSSIPSSVASDSCDIFLQEQHSTGNNKGLKNATLFEDGGIITNNISQSKVDRVNERNHNTHPLPPHEERDEEINERVGSCCSLVAKRYFDSLNGNGIRKTRQNKEVNNSEEDTRRNSSSRVERLEEEEEPEKEEIDVQVALLLYGPVILGE